MRKQASFESKAAQTPEPPAGKALGTIAKEDSNLQQAEVKMNQALHLSEIHNSFTQIGPHGSVQVPRVPEDVVIAEAFTGVAAENVLMVKTPTKANVKQQANTEQRAPAAQQRLTKEQAVRKMHSSPNRRGKRKRNELDAQESV